MNYKSIADKYNVKILADGAGNWSASPLMVSEPSNLLWEKTPMEALRKFSVANNHEDLWKEVSVVTLVEHTSLFLVMKAIVEDSGLTVECSFIKVNPRWVEFLADFESELNVLSHDELDAFAVGTEEEQQAIAQRSPVLTKCHQFLEDFFEGL